MFSFLRVAVVIVSLHSNRTLTKTTRLIEQTTIITNLENRSRTYFKYRLRIHCYITHENVPFFLMNDVEIRIHLLLLHSFKHNV